MEIDSLHKYISLVKLPNDTVEVSFSGQLCLTVSSNQFETIDSTSNISENHYWRINPIFAKLVYGANVFTDIPLCNEQYTSVESAIAGGLVKLHELGAFNTEVDLPEDSYAATISSISEDVNKYSIKNSKSLIEALTLSKKLITSIYDGSFILEDRESRSEFSANVSMRGNLQDTKSKSDPNKHKIKDQYGSVVSSHETESGAISAFNNLQNKKGMKIVKEDEDTEIDITPVEIVEKKTDIFSKFMNENSDEDYAKWEDEVKKTHPTKKLKFKGRIESGVDTISAEEPNVDRSYGVWDNKKNTGTVFKLED